MNMRHHCYTVRGVGTITDRLYWPHRHDDGIFKQGKAMHKLFLQRQYMRDVSSQVGKDNREARLNEFKVKLGVILQEEFADFVDDAVKDLVYEYRDLFTEC